ncbi:hypothetical protein AB0M95_12460 [Sphaerisporangium sp. NPDC051017]|uniref:hypothetical protein n=1 Tax=Sphaerisporangium sp. NPDC051017 TaxID=3154636 RepID=UPI003438EFDE
MIGVVAGWAEPPAGSIATPTLVAAPGAPGTTGAVRPEASGGALGERAAGADPPGRDAPPAHPRPYLELIR